ncbi:hypothetical protein D9611_014837 [Ephemerocybe angulata]|uniref:Rhodopsin domain-containing protein n=1 Tax=Ephemerocybe angulata TaxID=980116 RepID=A0A8H5F9K2_9AGAR|nr:hypothetical protein D9611_014837 [Tulosesus angulatus]
MRKFTPELERAFQVIVSCTYAVAIITTFVRLYRRRTVGRLWWDDWLAFASVLGSIWTSILFWLNDGGPEGSITATRTYSKARFFMGMVVSWTTIWLTRMSLAFGTSRIFPPQHPAHRLGLLAVRAFAFVLVTFLVAFTSQCAPASGWEPPPGVHGTRTMCFAPISGIYYPGIAGLLADAFLIALPIRALWKLKASRAFKWMLLSAFAASTIVTLTTIGLVIFQALPETWEPMKSETRFRLGFIEAATSVIVCNLIVLVSYVFRVLHGPSIRGGGSSAAANEYSLETRIGTGISHSDSHSAFSFTDTSSQVESENTGGTRSFGIDYIEAWDDYDPDTMQSASR